MKYGQIQINTVIQPNKTLEIAIQVYISEQECNIEIYSSRTIIPPCAAGSEQLSDREVGRCNIWICFEQTGYARTTRPVPSCEKEQNATRSQYRRRNESSGFRIQHVQVLSDKWCNLHFHRWLSLQFHGSWLYRKQTSSLRRIREFAVQITVSRRLSLR